MKPVTDDSGAILNAAVLHDSQVAGKRVRCPGCGVKVFEKWPEGWDAHAAHKCDGLEGRSEAEKKSEFKATFRRLCRP